MPFCKNLNRVKLNQKGVTHIILLLVLLAGVIVTVYLVQKSGFQIFRSKANEQAINFINGNCIQSQNGKQVLTCAGPVQFKLVSPLDVGSNQGEGEGAMAKPQGNPLANFSLVSTAYASEDFVGDSCKGSHVYNGNTDLGDCGFWTQRCGEIPTQSGTIATCFDRLSPANLEIGYVCTTDGKVTLVLQQGNMDTRLDCSVATSCQKILPRFSFQRFNAACLPDPQPQPPAPKTSGVSQIITQDPVSQIPKDGTSTTMTDNGFVTLWWDQHDSSGAVKKSRVIIRGDGLNPHNDCGNSEEVCFEVRSTWGTGLAILVPAGTFAESGTYIWFVQSVDANGDVRGSQASVFNIIKSGPAAPLPQLPANPPSSGSIGSTSGNSTGPTGGTSGSGGTSSGASPSCPITTENYPQCGGTTGLEDVPYNNPTHTIMVARLKDCHGKIVGYDVKKYKDLGDLGQCGTGNNTPGLGGPQTAAENQNNCTPITNISAPNGYRWEANCGSSCSQNSDCPPSSDPYTNGSNSYWCYGFANGNKCLALKYIGGDNSGVNPPTPTAATPTTPIPTSHTRVTKWYRFADNRADLQSAQYKPYTPGGATDEITFKDFSVGTTKSLFVQFKDDAGQMVKTNTGLEYSVANIDTLSQAPANSTLSASCSVTSTAVTNQLVQFVASVSSGRDQYVYNWTGDEVNQRNVSNNNTDQLTKKFDTTGSKRVAVIVSAGSDTVTANCLPVQVTNPSTSQIKCTDYYGSLVSHCGSMTYPLCDVAPETFCAGKTASTQFTCHAKESNLCEGQYECGSCATAGNGSSGAVKDCKDYKLNPNCGSMTYDNCDFATVCLKPGATAETLFSCFQNDNKNCQGKYKCGSCITGGTEAGGEN